MIIKTHSESYVNTDVVAKYEVVPVFRNELGNEFTRHATRPLDHFEVVAYFSGGNVTLGKYSKRTNAEEALDEAIDRLVNVDDIHVMSKIGIVESWQPA